MGDDHVDRPEVYAQQCVQLTGTNRPRAWIFGSNFARVRYGVLEGPAPRFARRTIDLGGHSGREIPVPIPNTEVKPASADGTWGATPWESRSPPELSDRGPRRDGGGLVAFGAEGPNA